MKYEELEQQLDTGDLILFQQNWWLGNLISYFTESNYSHCGVIVKDPDFGPEPLKGLYLLESTGLEDVEDAEDHEVKFGVQLRDFKEIYDTFQGNLYWRKLNCKRTRTFYERLRSTHSIIHNKPYDKYPNDWVKAKYNIQIGNVHRTDTFFCSALCSFVYVGLGLLSLNTEWTIITPAELGTEVKSEGEKVKFINCIMENEVLIK
jgi:hypothetical protein